MDTLYEYSEYSQYNRFPNLDGIEAKIAEHLLTSNTKYANAIWKLLKYSTKDALMKPDLTQKERKELIDGFQKKSDQSQITNTRVFLGPFVDDAWTEQCSSIYIFVDEVVPTKAQESNVCVSIETVTHSKINTIYGDADLICNPENTNINDYYYTDMENPTVQLKSRTTVLLKCILAELNGLYIDGIGYLSFDSHRIGEGSTEKRSKAELSLFNNRSFFGHSIRFNMFISGISENPQQGF